MTDPDYDLKKRISHLENDMILIKDHVQDLKDHKEKDEKLKEWSFKVVLLSFVATLAYLAKAVLDKISLLK